MKKLFAVLAVSTAVLTAYNANAEFNLVEKAQEVQNKQDELAKKVADAKTEATKKYEAKKAEHEAKAAKKKAEEQLSSCQATTYFVFKESPMIFSRYSGFERSPKS